MVIFGSKQLGAVHKLRWHDFGFFDHLPPCVDIFYGSNIDKNWPFLDYLPTSSCKHSLWTTPYRKGYNNIWKRILIWPELEVFTGILRLTSWLWTFRNWAKKCLIKNADSKKEWSAFRIDSRYFFLCVLWEF